MARRLRRVDTPLTPAQLERRRLIEAPIIFNVIPSLQRHAGVMINIPPLPEDGRRRYSPSPDDEEWLRNHPADEDFTDLGGD